MKYIFKKNIFNFFSFIILFLFLIYANYTEINAMDYSEKDTEALSEKKEKEKKRKRRQSTDLIATPVPSKEIDVEEKKEKKKEKREEEEEVSTSTPQGVVNEIMKDETFVRNIGITILNRVQDQKFLDEGSKTKHGSESFEIWKKMRYGATWAEKKKELNEEDRKKLVELFGDLNKAKMKMNREDFILSAKIILNNPTGKAKNVCKTGSIELITDHVGNDKNPYSIKFETVEKQITGTLYTKDSENKIHEKKLYKIYLTFNITDIATTISSSKKTVWNKKREDWDKLKEGYISTITPTE